MLRRSKWPDCGPNESMAVSKWKANGWRNVMLDGIPPLANNSPFKGLRVIELATFVAAPAAATMLADLGADVIKIETPGAGDPWRYQYSRPGLPKCDVNYLFQAIGRNKRSIGLDLKADAGRSVLRRMIRSTDVFITNLPIAARQRLCVSYESLSLENSRLVYGSVSGYGEVAGEVDEKAYDTTVWWGRSGLMEQFRAGPEGAPVRAPIAIGDHATALAFFGSIVAGLFQRQISGQGVHVGVSLLGTGAWVNACLIQAGLAGAHFDLRPARENTLNPLQCHYRCADDRWIMLIVGYEAHEGNWERLVCCLSVPHLLEDERFATYESRAQNCSSLIAILDDTFRRGTAADWVQTIRKAGFTVEVINSPMDAADDPQMKRAKVIVPLDGVPGAAETVTTPHWISGVTKERAGPAPRLSEHTEEVLRELGFAMGEIDELLRNRVVEIPGR
jgi:crotonobetainyl-CoA:carnitine CoA-transferase CaiB-like acyl-CoA transferase